MRKAAACAAADDLYLYGGGFTPELAGVIKRTYRGVYLLTYLKHEELSAQGREDTVEAARNEPADLLGETDPDPED